jgi:hypothetical protein
MYTNPILRRESSRDLFKYEYQRCGSRRKRVMRAVCLPTRNRVCRRSGDSRMTPEPARFHPFLVVSLERVYQASLKRLVQPSF